MAHSLGQGGIEPSRHMFPTPFRAAFWALGLAFTMTMVLLVPNPNKIRQALRAQRNPPLLPYERVLLARLDQEASSEEDVESEKAPAVSAVAPPEIRKPAPETPKDEPRQPVRVASADPSATLGLDPAAEVSPAPVSKPAPMPVASEPAVSVKAAPAASSDDSALSIPVPDPMHSHPATPVAGQSGTVPAPFPPATVRDEAPEVAAAARELMTSYGAEVLPGSSPHRWTFRFEDTPLPVVLKTLAGRGGSSVVIDPGITGSFTGQFADSDPLQAFALVIKSHRFTVNRRGSYLLIGVRSEQQIR